MSRFTISHYKETLKGYLENGYRDVTMGEKSDKKQVCLSHDVDIDVNLVLQMAEAENQVGVRSTWFFRAGAKNYNLFSRSTISIVKSLIGMGHEIGYHYEPISIKSIDPGLQITEFMKLYKSVTGVSMKYFNVHEPSRTSINISSVIPEINRCYNSPFFSDFKYISDSGARWREGCFCQHINSHKKLLILTHPFWWYKNSPCENY